MLIHPCPALAPSVTVTRLAMTVWGPKFRLDAVGLGVLNGYTVSRLEALPFTSVTLSTAAVADAGTGNAPTPVTCKARTRPCPIGPPVFRVSRMRNGVTGA